MAKLNQIERQDLVQLTSLLKKILPNKKLLKECLDQIQGITFEGTIPLIVSRNVLGFKYPNGDSYSININGSQIESYISQKSDGIVQKTTISYFKDFVFVTIDGTYTEMDEFTQLPSSILRQTDYKVYKENELVYRRMFKSKATSSLNTYDCQTNSREVYVSDDRIAYIRDISISNDQMNVPKIDYRKSVSFNPPPFNNLVNTEQREKPFIYESNENEFKTAVLKLSNPERIPKK